MLKAVILAGSRGVADPVATAEGVAHKALVDIDGATMLARVAHALAGAEIGTVSVSTSDGAVGEAAAALGLQVIPAESGPSLSTTRALATLGAPLLVTTADHGLLAPAWIRALLAGVPASADIAVLLARRETIERDLPGSRRTYLRFADGAWSGCNLFYLATPRAAAALDLWRDVEADRKRPWRIVRRFGLRPLIRYLLGAMTIAEAVDTLGRLAGVDAAVVESPYGLAAVDVDTLDDLAAARLLARRLSGSGSIPGTCR